MLYFFSFSLINGSFFWTCFYFPHNRSESAGPRPVSDDGRTRIKDPPVVAGPPLRSQWGGYCISDCFSVSLRLLVRLLVFLAPSLCPSPSLCPLPSQSPMIKSYWRFRSLSARLFFRSATPSERIFCLPHPMIDPI